MPLFLITASANKMFTKTSPTDPRKTDPSTGGNLTCNEALRTLYAWRAILGGKTPCLTTQEIRRKPHTDFTHDLSDVLRVLVDFPVERLYLAFEAANCSGGCVGNAVYSPVQTAQQDFKRAYSSFMVVNAPSIGLKATQTKLDTAQPGLKVMYILFKTAGRI
jgi:hypothetical protein